MKNTLSSTGVELDDWNVLTGQEQVEKLVKVSKERPQLIYKHSHRCGTCFMARKEIEDTFDEISEQADMNFVNVVKHRPASDQITEQVGARHESPQVLIIKDGEAVWHESHHSIKSEGIMKNL